mmetsp:Transcript_18221/g.37899  ORF Transcript_18221/g.37899 Transcript_18221/m.37899 type:complete len:213 (+) Transcript_18221:299-937(+)
MACSYESETRSTVATKGGVTFRHDTTRHDTIDRSIGWMRNGATNDAEPRTIQQHERRSRIPYGTSLVVRVGKEGRSIDRWDAQRRDRNQHQRRGVRRDLDRSRTCSFAFVPIAGARPSKIWRRLGLGGVVCPHSPRIRDTIDRSFRHTPRIRDKGANTNEADAATETAATEREYRDGGECDCELELELQDDALQDIVGVGDDGGRFDPIADR